MAVPSKREAGSASPPLTPTESRPPQRLPAHAPPPRLPSPGSTLFARALAHAPRQNQRLRGWGLAGRDRVLPAPSKGPRLSGRGKERPTCPSPRPGPTAPTATHQRKGHPPCRRHPGQPQPPSCSDNRERRGRATPSHAHSGGHTWVKAGTVKLIQEEGTKKRPHLLNLILRKAKHHVK